MVEDKIKALAKNIEIKIQAGMKQDNKEYLLEREIKCYISNNQNELLELESIIQYYSTRLQEIYDFKPKICKKNKLNTVVNKRSINNTKRYLSTHVTEH